MIRFLMYRAAFLKYREAIVRCGALSRSVKRVLLDAIFMEYLIFLTLDSTKGCLIWGELILGNGFCVLNF